MALHQSYVGFYWKVMRAAGMSLTMKKTSY